MSKHPFGKIASITCLIALPVLADPTEDFFAGPKYLWADFLMGPYIFYDKSFSGGVSDDGQFTTGLKLNAGVNKWVATFEYTYDRSSFAQWSGEGLLIQKNILLGVRSVKPYSYSYVAVGIGSISRELERPRLQYLSNPYDHDQYDYLGTGSWFGMPIEAGMVFGTSVGIGINLFANINQRIPLGGFYVSIPLGKSTPRAMFEQPMPEALSDSRNPKFLSLNKAYAWAIGGTLLPIVAGGSLIAMGATDPSGVIQKPYLIGGLLLIGSGALFGPSLGEFYSGDQHYGWWGAGIRTGSVVVPGLLVVLLNMTSKADLGDERDLVGPLLLPVGLFLGSTIYSFVHTHTSVMKANEKIKAERFGFSPTLSPASNGGLNTGLLGWMKF